MWGRIILIAAISLSLYAQANAETLKRLRQFEHVEGRSLKSYLNEGYEIKAINPTDNASDSNYFLQKGSDLIKCTEMSIKLGNYREIYCSRLVEPTPY